MAFGRRSIPVEVGGDGRFVVPAREFVPAYLATYESGRLREKVDEALEALRGCRLCPRDCEVDRLANRFAVCKSGRYARVSSAFHHFGEEDVLRGWNGSGTIFFGWCNLRCVFCQNWETSQKGEGAEVTPGELARLMLRLQAEGCHNINFVTPEHVVPQILEALPPAVEGGLRLPLVYNTSGSRSPPSTAGGSASRIWGTTCSGVTKLMLWHPSAWSRSMSRASSPGVTSAPSPFWLVSQFWQKTQRRLHQPKKMVPEPFQ